MSRIFVFLGPTLVPAEAALHTTANILPPARLGDIHDAATRLQARAIGLVDGRFGTVPAVWHKEILFALSRGVRVFGAASMGALRAAELHAFGMEGVGAIFRAFADGTLTDDDEVAVAHAGADAGHRPLSEALVNIRHGLWMAEEAGSISAATHARLRAHAKATFYAQRSWPALFRAAPELGVPEDELVLLRALVARVRPNRKRDDAVEMLRAITEAGGEAMPPHVPAFEFEATTFWEKAAAELTRDEREAPRHEELARHALLARGGDERRRGALLLALALAEAQRLQIEPTDADLRAAAERFRRARGLHGRGDMIAWLKGQDMGPGELHELLRVEALVDAVAGAHGGGIRGLVALELQRRGEFGRVRDELAAAPRGETWSDSGLTREELLRWYEREIQWLGPDLTRAAHALGYATIDELLNGLARIYRRLAPG